jgi:hypothetical protein
MFKVTSSVAFSHPDDNDDCKYDGAHKNKVGRAVMCLVQSCDVWRQIISRAKKWRNVKMFLNFGAKFGYDFSVC